MIIEYLHDPDSVPVRAQLDLCREIRNLLSHNADGAGEPVVEPSEAVLRTLFGILEHVQRPRLAVDYGTPMESILFAHPSDPAANIMRHMLKKGYSHIPVRDKTGLIGVFSALALFKWITRNGFEGIPADLRVGDLGRDIGFDEERNEKYLFLPPDATLLTVRDAFEQRIKPNSRLAAVFITEDGTRQGALKAMLTPWDVLRNTQEEPNHGTQQ